MFVSVLNILEIYNYEFSFLRIILLLSKLHVYDVEAGICFDDRQH